MLILDLWGISFHAVVVFGLGKDLLFKSVVGHCVVNGPFKLGNMLHSIFAQISQEGVKCNRAKKYLRSYCTQ